MASKDGTERRVYNLPESLLARIRAFAVDQAITNETEAVRRLLDMALQLRDTVHTINATLRAKFIEERNVRALARDILTDHIKVKSVRFTNDGSVEYELDNATWGQLTRQGKTFTNDNDGHDNYWQVDPPPTPANPARNPGGWDSGKKADVDDDIPF